MWGMETKQGTVLYYCLEDTLKRIQQRLYCITAELGGRRPNPDLHQRLRELAEARLRAAGAGALTDPQSAEGLGERAFGLLTGAPRRLTPDDLTHVIDRIEEL